MGNKMESNNFSNKISNLFNLKFSVLYLVTTFFCFAFYALNLTSNTDTESVIVQSN